MDFHSPFGCSAFKAHNSWSNMSTRSRFLNLMTATGGVAPSSEKAATVVFVIIEERAQFCALDGF